MLHGGDRAALLGKSRTADRRQVRNTLVSSTFFTVGDTGPEHLMPNPGNKGNVDQGGAKSGALGAESSDLPPELQEVLSAWESLPEITKVGILAMVRAQEG